MLLLTRRRRRRRRRRSGMAFPRKLRSKRMPDGRKRIHETETAGDIPRWQVLQSRMPNANNKCRLWDY